MLYVKSTVSPEQHQACLGHKFVSRNLWNRTSVSVGSFSVKGRAAWGAAEPNWAQEVVYYNTETKQLSEHLNRIVVHHTDNFASIKTNESRQQSRGFAALGYHFFIDTLGNIYEGRPLEVMGSHAGAGFSPGVENDPDFGAVGIVLQGDFHHADNGLFTSDSEPHPDQMAALKGLIKELSNTYKINRLLLHSEVARAGGKTDCPGDFLAKKIEELRTELEMKGQ